MPSQSKTRWNAAEVEGLYRRYGPSVYRRALSILRNPAEAQDAMQEVFTTVITKGDSFQGTSAVMTWLYSVTTHLCLNRLRDSRRRAELLAARAGELSDPEVGAGASDPENLHLVQELLSTVPEEEARAAVHAFFDDLSHEEIAPLLGCSRRKVGDLLNRFRLRLLEQEERS